VDKEISPQDPVDSGGNDHNREDKEEISKVVVSKVEASNEIKVVGNKADNPQDPVDNVSKGKADSNNDHKEIRVVDSKVVAINNGLIIPTEISNDQITRIEINNDPTTRIRARAVINRISYFPNSYL
jgi:hypothetical protein